MSKIKVYRIKGIRIGAKSKKDAKKIYSSYSPEMIKACENAEKFRNSIKAAGIVIKSMAEIMEKIFSGLAKGNDHDT